MIQQGLIKLKSLHQNHCGNVRQTNGFNGLTRVAYMRALHILTFEKTHISARKGSRVALKILQTDTLTPHFKAQESKLFTEIRSR